MDASERVDWIERSGRRLAYAEYGAPDGSPVVLCHGTPGSHVVGELLHESATDAHVRLVVPDRPGIGRSSFRPGRTIDDWPGSVAALARTLSFEEFGVVGFSGGGPYALATAGAMPDRVTSAGLLASAAPPTAPREELQVATRLAAALACHVPIVARAAFRAQAWALDRSGPSAAASVYTDREVGPDGVDPEVADVLETNVRTALSNSARGVVHDLALLDSNWGVALSSISAPVSAHYGGQDASAPVSHGEFLVERLPEADLDVHPHADHLAILTDVGPSVLDEVAPS